MLKAPISIGKLGVDQEGFHQQTRREERSGLTSPNYSRRKRRERMGLRGVLNGHPVLNRLLTVHFTPRSSSRAVTKSSSLPDGLESRVSVIAQTVLSRPGFPEAAWVIRSIPYDRFLKLQDFAEFFAELCALLAPITPFYSVENITTPAFSHRLLTERL